MRFKALTPFSGTTPLKRLRSYKRMAFVAAWVLLLSSCVTERRVNEYLQKHPQPADTIFKQVISYRDTVIYITLPADTVTDSLAILLNLPEPVTTEGYVSDTVNVEDKFASASAWVVKNKLKIQLRLNKTTLAFAIDSAATVNTKTVTITKNVTVEKRVVPPFYKATLFVSIALFLLFVIGIFLYSRR
jgi:PBP1b-binding outer membrane lipoprotein LpoB